MRFQAVLTMAIWAFAAGCGGHGRMNPVADGGNGDGPLPGQPGSCNGVEFGGCYTVYAHSDHILYKIDLQKKLLVEIGPFNAPQVPAGTKTAEDVITDLAVAPDDSVYGISRTNLYSVDAKDGHVTLVGPVTACGMYAVALTFTPDGKLYAGDFAGAFCGIDLTTHPPTVTQIGTVGSGMALSGDLVAVGDGTVYGTAYNLADARNTGTQINNLLVKIDPTTGHSIQVMGATGFPKLFGVAFELGKVFGFTHDGTGDVVTIDPMSGQGTLYNSFMDPTTGTGISFAGAGVNSTVSPIIQ